MSKYRILSGLSSRAVRAIVIGSLVAATIGGRAATLSAQTPPKVYVACYVPLTGTVYRIKEAGLKTACTATHVEFSWTDGADALRVTDAAGGDLSGVFSQASVVRLLGRALATTPPTTGQVLAFDGTSWTPMAFSGGVTDHGALTGLSNDDHPQYLLTDGVRTATNGFAVNGVLNTGSIPASGDGVRLMWYPGKAAFRVGAAEGGGWSDALIGQHSIAMGRGARASGAESFAWGRGANASASNALAFGGFANAQHANSMVFTTGRGGNSSVADQIVLNASGGISLSTPTGAPGFVGCGITSGNLSCSGTLGGSNAAGQTVAISPNGGIVATSPDFAGGTLNANGAGTRLVWFPAIAAFRAGSVNGTQWDQINLGFASSAFGLSSQARGTAATAFGDRTTADANGSVAAGTLATSLQAGSFVFGDRSTALSTQSTITANVANEFAVRAAGGFRFRTSPDLSTGCDIGAGSGTMSCTSSRLAKRGFENLNGEEVLSKVARMPIQSWSYRNEPGNVRHVGPTAQDFHAAFGLGNSDLAISLVDIDGINLLGVQALERRTKHLEHENAELRAQLAELAAAVKRLQGGTP